MAHALEADIVDFYGEAVLQVSADRDGNLIADSVAIARELSAASGLIDGKLWTAGALVPAPAPEIVKKWCVDIALYELSTGPAYTDEKRQRYEDALAALNRIADGKDRYAWFAPIAAAIDPTPVLFSAAQRVFSRTTLADW
ncbi:MAG: DUF1320 domain-containing protein [Gammaproteobacteria bacterium]